MSTQKHEHRADKVRARDSGRESASEQAAPSGDAEAQAVIDAQAAQAESQAAAERCAEKVIDTSAELLAARAEIKVLRDDLAAANDKYLRKLADEVNFRKRMVRDKEDARRFAIFGFLGDVVPLLDDFDRAISHAPETDQGGLRDGVQMIRRQFGQMLETKYGLKRMQTAGSVFDPNLHEAVNMEFGDTEEPVVCEEYLSGYIVEDRVVRTAKVKVKMPSPAASPAAETAAAPEESMNDPGTGEETLVRD